MRGAFHPDAFLWEYTDAIIGCDAVLMERVFLGMR